MASAQTFPLRVVVDSREQAPWSFTGASVYEGTQVVQGSLQSGDYSLEGFEHLVACERKSLPDLVACLGRERPRFARELERARGLDAFCVVVEGSWQELAQGQYRSQLQPHSACQSIASFMARMGVPFWFCGTRPAAEYCCWSFLRQWLQGRVHELKAVERMLKTPAPASPAGAPGAPAGACARGMDRHTESEPQDLQDAFGGPAGACPGMVPDGRSRAPTEVCING